MFLVIPIILVVGLLPLLVLLLILLLFFLFPKISFCGKKCIELLYINRLYVWFMFH